MPQSLVKNLVPLVFSTKHRQPWLPDDVRDSLFAYQAGIFTQVRRYIENQREQHRKVTFQEELRALLKRHGAEFDERYLWD